MRIDGVPPTLLGVSVDAQDGAPCVGGDGAALVWSVPEAADPTLSHFTVAVYDEAHHTEVEIASPVPVDAARTSAFIDVLATEGAVLRFVVGAVGVAGLRAERAMLCVVDRSPPLPGMVAVPSGASVGGGAFAHDADAPLSLCFDGLSTRTSRRSSTRCSSAAPTRRAPTRWPSSVRCSTLLTKAAAWRRR